MAACLPVRKNIDISTCVALFCTLHYTCLNGVYFSLEYRGVELKAEVYMGDVLGPRKMNVSWGKMTRMGTMDRGFTVTLFVFSSIVHSVP